MQNNHQKELRKNIKAEYDYINHFVLESKPTKLFKIFFEYWEKCYKSKTLQKLNKLLYLDNDKVSELYMALDDKENELYIASNDNKKVNSASQRAIQRVNIQLNKHTLKQKNNSDEPNTNITFEIDNSENNVVRLIIKYNGKDLILKKIAEFSNDIDSILHIEPVNKPLIISYLQNLLDKNNFNELDSKLNILNKQTSNLDIYNFFKGASIVKSGLTIIDLTITISPQIYFNSIDPDSKEMFIKGQRLLYGYYFGKYKKNISVLKKKMHKISYTLSQSGIRHPFNHFLIELSNSPIDIGVTIDNFTKFKDTFSDTFNFQLCLIQFHADQKTTMNFNFIYWIEFYAVLFLFAVRLLNNYKGEEQNHIISKINKSFGLNIITLYDHQKIIKQGFRYLGHPQLFTSLAETWVMNFNSRAKIPD